MLAKKAGYALVAVGILVLAGSLGADLVGLGSKGIQAAQLLGAQAGVIVSLGGLALIIAAQHGQLDLSRQLGSVKSLFANQPLIVWALAGFLLAYFMFFISSMFLDYRLQFQYFYRYLPDNVRIGLDIRTITKYVNYWLVEGKSIYFDDTYFYTPLCTVILAPIILLGYPNSYYLMLALGLISYILMTFILPSHLNPRREYSFLLFFFVTGLFSYGFQFELERGQFNVIVFLFCLFAVYLFHYHEEYRLLAYVIFSVCIQIKISPLIFIVMFVKDWRDWKNNLLRFASIGLFNLALLFVLGYSFFMDFMRSMNAQVAVEGVFTWIGNHSIRAFVYNFTKDGFGWFSESSLAWLRQNTGLLEWLLLLYFALCFGSILVAAYLRKEKGLNPYLLVACTIGAMVIPSISHDYKLSILAAPLSIAFSNLVVPHKKPKKVVLIFLVLIASFAYSVTLYPFKYRPEFLANSFPLLMVILTVFTIAFHLDERTSRCLTVREPAEDLAGAVK